MPRASTARWLRAHTTQRYYMLCGPWSWERSLTCECLSARATLCTVTAPPNLSTGVQGLRSRMVVNAPADLAILLICTEPGRRPWGVVHGVPSLNRLHAILRIIFASAALWRADFRYNCHDLWLTPLRDRADSWRLGLSRLVSGEKLA